MKKARTIIITIIVTAVCCSIMALVVVGSMFTERQTEPQEEPETTYFEYGTTIRSINMVSESAKYYITYWLPDMLEGRENNDKYVEFWGEDGLQKRQDYYYEIGYWWRNPVLDNMGYNSKYTIKNVSEIEAENIRYMIYGKDELLPGEILVHKWDYLNMCFERSGLYVSGYTLDQVIESDNNLPKYIMTLSTHGMIRNFGLAADYYNLSSESAPQNWDCIEVEMAEYGINTSPRVQYKVVGYYENPTDDEIFTKTYTMDQFSNLTQDDNDPKTMTDTEKAIREQIESITRVVYVNNG